MAEESNRSLLRAAAVLDALEYDTLTLSELSRRTQVPTSSMHRLAVSLEELGFLRRDAQGRYGLGRRFQRTRMETAVRQTLARVRDETGESCQFWIKLHRERLCVAIADSGHELRPILAEGTRIALSEGGSAGELLASTSLATDSLKHHGWVESVDQRTPGIASVSFPLVVGGRMHGAICLVMPSSRIIHSPGQDHGQVVSGHISALRTELAAMM